MHSLQHRRDVSGLTTLYKAQEQWVAHLQQIRQPVRCVEVNTRAVLAAPVSLDTPRSHTSHHSNVHVVVEQFSEFRQVPGLP